MIYTMGVDIGSTTSKCVVLRDGREIAGKALFPRGTGSSGPGRVVNEALESSGLTRGDMSFILATGYGRASLEIADQTMSELSCHARGASFLFPGARTVVDIGGQDVKALKLGEDGNLEKFVMNDKCAAGTGRFIEVMARVLEIEIGDMERLSAQSTERVDISSTCTVFAESEVISQLAGNKSKCDIVKGIHRSVASRVIGLVRRVGIAGDVVMTGGVASNAGVRLALEEELGLTIAVSPLSQYAGALGAALLAYRKATI